MSEAEDIANERIAGLQQRLSGMLAKYRALLAENDLLHAELAIHRGGFARHAADSEPATFDPPTLAIARGNQPPQQ